MVTRLVLVLGDQLSRGLSALGKAERGRDVVVMAEVAEETGYVPHHPKKIAFVLSAMRHFAEELRDEGWQVAYTKLDDKDAPGSIPEAILAAAQTHGASEVLATQPGEWRLRAVLQEMPLKMTLLSDDRFLCSAEEFDAWATGRKELRMEFFYREMRRKTGLMMEGDQPAGGKWNFDHDNRKRATTDMFRARPARFREDAITQDVLSLVARRFGNNFGKLEAFGLAVTRGQALKAMDHFIAHLLPEFGDTQDAMLQGDRFLHHSLLSPYLNVGLLGPLELCERVEKAWAAGDVPINAAEGFIRQIIGWREYVRGIYFREGPEYTSRNALEHSRPLPDVYWGGNTQMTCMAHAVAQTREEAYAHHIQRLMVTGNFGLLTGIDPHALHEWYLAVYFDAFEWVEAPNTIGMSQYADGGIIASKPYVSSGAYINKMSDYCSNCAYKVKVKTGPDACPFNTLYWHFLDRHRERFKGNHRMGMIYRTWDKMDADHKRDVLATAEHFLERLDRGDAV
ncbi:cryptochrome/photolyase family protein [Pelagicola sp. LXJ1103]|uniref:cryptochrome/photolyase family protein n=1 Tax=Roseovarius carneus TaxID=2853164 RepID=UPI000D61791E|nr:cryptochrome/photolyase family protein [Roseovarius carneus]PWE36571.1 cryptochrome/photolyase family protein [Pelagicola sp. LXJ1103]